MVRLVINLTYPARKQETASPELRSAAVSGLTLVRIVRFFPNRHHTCLMQKVPWLCLFLFTITAWWSVKDR